MEPVLDQYLTTAELAELCRTVPSTVRYWRRQGTGPKGVRRGKRVLYAASTVAAWMRDDEQLGRAA